MKTNHPSRNASGLAGLAAAIFCSGIWLSFGMFLFAIQSGGVA